MYKLEFTLKQHTPIIHFQHDQDGATLRATEVKPKLDRFILMKLGKEEDATLTKNEDIYMKGLEVAKVNGWISKKNNKPALNYKFIVKESLNENMALRLEFEINQKEQDQEKKWVVKRKNTNPAMILGNMAGKPSKKELKDLRLYDTINCEIFSYQTALITYLTNSIIEFFATLNFGNRSNKGYGSFSVSVLNQRNVVWNEGNLPNNTFYLEIPTSDIKKVFDVIDFFYKWLKSGINYTFDRNDRNNPCKSSRYKKAFLFEYLESLYSISTTNYNWEKRWLKENYLSLTTLSSSYTPKFYRGILGLSDKLTFTKATCCSDPNFVSTFQTGLRYKIELHNNHLQKQIDRIKSPFSFKVIISNGVSKAYILIEKDHIEELYNTGIDKRFYFFEKPPKVNYRIGNNNYRFEFNYLKDDLSIIETHLNRLLPHTNILALKEKYDIIEKFKNSFHRIELPNSLINYDSLLAFFKTKYPKFHAKDFMWRNVTISEIELKTTV